MKLVSYRRSFLPATLATYLYLFCLEVLYCCFPSHSIAQTVQFSGKNNVIWRLADHVENLLPYNNDQINLVAPIIQEIWDGLNNLDPVTDSLIPCLASLPEVSEDGLSYTYSLNEQARWSDGNPVTAEDVLFSIKLSLNPELDFSIQGTTIDSCHIDKQDPRKITIHTTDVYSLGRYQISRNIPILPKHLFDPLDLSDAIAWKSVASTKALPIWRELAKPFTSPHKYEQGLIVGSGPYKIKLWEEEGVVLERVDNHWGTNQRGMEAYPQELSFVTIYDDSLAIESLRHGYIDVLKGVPMELVDSLSKFPGINCFPYFRNFGIFLGWNQRNTLFKDKDTRKALTMLINRDFLVTAVSNNRFVTIEGPVALLPKSFDSTISQPAYNPAKAMQVLRKEGWEDSDGDGILDKKVKGKKKKFQFTVLLFENSYLINTANWIRNELKRDGILMELEILDKHDDFYQKLQKGKFDAAILANVPNVDEQDYYFGWHSEGIKNGENYCAFKSAKADSLLEELDIEYDDLTRIGILEEFQREVIEQQPATFLFNTPFFLFSVDRFDNVKSYNKRNSVEIKTWRVRSNLRTSKDVRKG